MLKDCMRIAINGTPRVGDDKEVTKKTSISEKSTIAK